MWRSRTGRRGPRLSRRSPFWGINVLTLSCSRTDQFVGAKVFISYRRDDSRYPARMIHAALCQVIPRDDVFMDVDSIPPGASFRKILKDWVAQCEVLLALIGPGWLDAPDPKTQRSRLDNPSDFVRIEIGEALARDIPVVPVLIDGTPMPDIDLLPDDLKGLVDRQAEFVEYRTFDADVERLIRKLKLSQGVSRTSSLQEPSERAPDEKDIEARLINYLTDEFEKDQGVDLRKDAVAVQRLADAAEKAVLELSSSQQTSINLPFITADATGPKHLEMRLTRARLESLVTKAEPERAVELPFLMPIEDVFQVSGRGIVAVGTVKCGTCRVGQKVVLLKDGMRFRQCEVISIELFRRIVEQAQAGDHVGFLLRGITSKTEIEPGMVLFTGLR
jgi:hypothetical protein